MKKLKSAMLATTLCLLITGTTAAQEDVAVAPDPAPVEDDGLSTHVVGVTISMGMATVIWPDCNNCSLRFAGGGDAHYNFFLTDVFGLHAGIGMIGRGVKASAVVNQTNQDEQKIKVLYMDIPLGIKLRFSSFQWSLGVSLDFALSGKSVDPDMDFNDAMWETWARRFNLGVWTGLGWAIHAGPIDIVPGFSWNMHILNEVTAEGSDQSIRPMNLMFNIGVDYGL